jgi:predicted site-specific integrase-resolvase
MGRFYRIGEFAKAAGVSRPTLIRWDKAGVLCPRKLPSGHRVYSSDDLRQVTNPKVAVAARKTVVYCRVSSVGQKNDLASQVTAMETFCLSAGIPVSEWVSEIGGGMNFERKKFLTIIDEIQTGEIEHLLVAHKDRLCRFGFELIEHLAVSNGCKLTVVNQESLSPEAEMVQDLLSIVHTFSCRLYGLRRYKKASDLL